MPAAASEVPSTLAPSDSASAAPSRRSKPGKSERAARRAATGSQSGQQASSAKAMTFASGMAAPKPTPGKFPVVFQTGAGEPTRDTNFCPDPDVLANSVESFPARYTWNSAYSEFLTFTDIEDLDFNRQLKTATMLRLAQQLVHAHVNMGLPQGDFAPVASSDVRLPAAISAFVSQYGEFSVPALGTRYLLRDYTNTVKSVIWTADQLMSGDNEDGERILRRSWLPMSKTDGHTKQIIAAALTDFIVTNANLAITSTVLEDAVLSGAVPDAWNAIKSELGATDALRNRFDFLFSAYNNSTAFVVAWTTAGSTAALSEIGIVWENPSAAHVDWSYNAKEAFTRLSDDWARISASYAKFFEMSSSQSNRVAAAGSQSQFAHVSTRDSVTVVKTFLALSAPEFSLVACFPSTGIFSGGTPRNVVVTTPLSVVQRATEFVQLDWRN